MVAPVIPFVTVYVCAFIFGWWYIGVVHGFLFLMVVYNGIGCKCSNWAVEPAFLIIKEKRILIYVAVR